MSELLEDLTPKTSTTPPTYANRLKDSIYWWLSTKKSFVINDEYKIELLVLDRIHHSAKIKITKLDTNETSVQEV